MLTLFIDADDTLWENNIYFEAVVEHYCTLVGRHGVDADDARARLLGIERVRTKTHGYGIRNFNQSLREACLGLLDGLATPLVEELDTHCAGIAAQPMTLLPGVADTLAALAARYRLIMLTKGDAGDQHQKVERSGLRKWFHAVDVVHEKDTEAYAAAARRHGVQACDTWMIGNSPRSDVVPALAAGWGAVFIPHVATWALELEALPLPRPGDRFLQLERFDQLCRHF